MKRAGKQQWRLSKAHLVSAVGSMVILDMGSFRCRAGSEIAESLRTMRLQLGIKVPHSPYTGIIKQSCTLDAAAEIDYFNTKVCLLAG